MCASCGYDGRKLVAGLPQPVQVVACVMQRMPQRSNVTSQVPGGLRWGMRWGVKFVARSFAVWAALPFCARWEQARKSAWPRALVRARAACIIALVRLRMHRGAKAKRVRGARPGRREEQANPG